MTRWAWCNGLLCAEHELLLPVRDGAVLYGASLFETLRCYDGHPFRLEQHLQRLRRWMERLHLFARARQAIDLSTSAVQYAVAQLLEANGLLDGDARLRITVTAGSEEVPPSCLMLAGRISPEQIAQWQAGVSAVLLPDPRGVRGEQPKWGSYAWHLEAQLQAKTQGAEEAIWFSREGYLTEGAISNVFVLHEDRLLTPPLDEGVLAGITRQVVLEIAWQAGVQCSEERVPVALLPRVQAVLLTNSVREIVPVALLDGVPFAVHPLVAKMQEAYRSLVRSCAPL
ncbi:MAG: aminotransferase class IV [Armatimonadota bacterium]|nr:aminotransferase class IV [bacterium]MDW8320931.1 aminotransferase class IV [Armatimonadota bacterium]